MSKKRKNKRKINQKSYCILFILALIFFAALTVWHYKNDPKFRSEADETVALVTEKAEEAISETKQLIEEKISEKSSEEKKSPAPKKSAPAKKLVALPEKLEIPVCTGKGAKTDHEIRKFENYTLCYRESYEQAEWSAYCLTEDELVKNAKRSDDFRADPEITTGSATPADYKKSGYDRGHLSPAADFAFSEKAMSETFYMSNMSPQKGSLNRGLWKDLESQVRLWAANFGRVYVVSGPVLEKPASEYKTIGENQVVVPEFYYKVILAPLYADENDKASPEDAQSVLAMAYIFPNEKCEGSLDDYQVTVDEVESRTGLDFFSMLEDKVENEIERQIKR
ncbi:DNA/RNA non-specific endonuclease [Treponema ruminis]|uniref:Endonuclease n=1 Tax=Treponema ruminis TaxID=744515 RepID=A0A7W8LME7_9SPIR|nr:DNA/RNA non-specific endonuclease [Treponema ruminis]MBB5226456.1 endonuclease G [Treponema ruminis]QSI02640.1 DNA/RNA non-specific endonuclease [Treponema ruminis]